MDEVFVEHWLETEAEALELVEPLKVDGVAALGEGLLHHRLCFRPKLQVVQRLISFHIVNRCLLVLLKIPYFLMQGLLLKLTTIKNLAKSESENSRIIVILPEDH